jgi:hypothetical protein
LARPLASLKLADISHVFEPKRKSLNQSIAPEKITNPPNSEKPTKASRKLLRINL